MASRRGLRMLIAGSVRGEDRGNPEAQVLRSAALASTWDTYGWILFKEGLTTEAELWLRAAWTDTQDAQSGSHLAALLQKQGRTAEAAAILHLVQEKAVPSPTSAARNSALSQDRGHAAGLPLTSIEVPRSSGIPPGNADFLFDLSLGAPQSAQFLQGDEALAPMEFALAKVDTHTIIPPGTSAHLYRLARLHCDAGAVCTLELLPLGSESAR
ncbi:MAG: hypothetical protein INR71_13710 [Terriglobus roseus]|nr:hypothetical protein [Terriglobus roseus]